MAIHLLKVEMGRDFSHLKGKDDLHQTGHSRGRLEVTVGDGAPRVVTPGECWFESGREPVLAVPSPGAETSFIRFSVLPGEIRGQSSILYVDPADAGRGRPRRYTVLVDEPIAL